MLPPRKDSIPNQYSKSPAILPLGKDPIPNQYSNITINEEDPIIPPILAKYPTGYKPLFNDMHYPNKTECDLNFYTDSSRTDIEEYLNKLDINKDEDNDHE